MSQQAGLLGLCLLDHDSGGAGRAQGTSHSKQHNLLLDWISYSRSTAMASRLWVLLSMSKEAGELVQGLIAHAALPEDLRSVSSIHCR